MNVARALADRLKALDTEYFFLLTGGDQPLWIALHEADIKMVVARSEFGSVYMADGYARASGKPGITYGQAGPGAANVAAALADPYWAQSPVVAITGANSTRTNYIGEYQSLDQMPMFAPVTKWNGHAATPSRVPDLASLAIRQAMAGSRGPTHLDIPKNFFGADIEYSGNDRSSIEPLPPVFPDSALVSEVLQSLLRAQRPVILAGEGAVLSGAGESIVSLAEELAIPVATTLGGKTGIPYDHPLNLGVTGRYSAKVANDVVGDSDCVLVLGSRLGGLATRGYTVPDPSAQIIMVDTDPSAFDVSYPGASRVLGDAKLTVDAILEESRRDKANAAGGAWTQNAKGRIAEWREEVQRAIADSANAAALSPIEIMHLMGKYSREITVVADTGSMAAWTGVLYPTVRPGSYFRAIGSLGWALPASLGVQLARPEKVVCVIGDGGAGYHIADIETAVRLKIPPVIVILNNSGLIFEYQLQKYRFDGNVVPEANDLSDVDYAAVARALGAESARITTSVDFKEAFAKALETDKPTVLDVVIDREAIPPVTNFEDVMDRKI